MHTNDENEKITPGFQTEWKTPNYDKSDTEMSKQLAYSRIVISPPLFLHPMVITYSQDAEKFQTNIACKWRLAKDVETKVLKLMTTQQNVVIGLRKTLDSYCFEKDILVQRFNPFAPKDSNNPYHVVLIYRTDSFLGADNIRQMQIKFSAIKKDFYNHINNLYKN